MGPSPPIFPSNNRGNLSLLSTLKTAKQIGLTIPPSLLARTEKAIK
jgi:hypothetical protein